MPKRVLISWARWTLKFIAKHTVDSQGQYLAPVQQQWPGLTSQQHLCSAATCSVPAGLPALLVVSGLCLLVYLFCFLVLQAWRVPASLSTVYHKPNNVITQLPRTTLYCLLFLEYSSTSKYVGQNLPMVITRVRIKGEGNSLHHAWIGNSPRASLSTCHRIRNALGAQWLHVERVNVGMSSLSLRKELCLSYHTNDCLTQSYVSLSHGDFLRAGPCHIHALWIPKTSSDTWWFLRFRAIHTLNKIILFF